MVDARERLPRTQQDDEHQQNEKDDDYEDSEHGSSFEIPVCTTILPRDVSQFNVWKDEAANAAVRAVNHGDELTPTALIGDEVLRNPSAKEVLAALETP